MTSGGGASVGTGYAWLLFSLLSVAAWGGYGILLHGGQAGMADPVNGRYKAFLFVGVAYFFTAVLAPLAWLLARGSSFRFPGAGVVWSLLAGVAGAVGAFGVLLAFGARGTPPVVMSIVFAGAPVVNAVVSLVLQPPAGGFGAVRWPFFAGILLAALGGCLVTLYKPNPAPHPHPAGGAVAAAAAAPPPAARPPSY
jgi:drug/metabolite transporter (DMT)-like permease